KGLANMPSSSAPTGPRAPPQPATPSVSANKHPITVFISNLRRADPAHGVPPEGTARVLGGAPQRTSPPCDPSPAPHLARTPHAKLACRFVARVRRRRGRCTGPQSAPQAAPGDRDGGPAP